MSEETTCAGTHRCICSPGSVDGRLRSEWPGGPTTDQSGPGAVPASRFPSPGGGAGQLTLDICGPQCDGSSPSAGRKSSSGSRSHPQKLSARSLKLLSLSRFKRATTRGLIGSLTDLLAARVCITGEGGSMEYQQTLRNSVTPGGTPYVAHTASGRRTSGRDCGGWPTARAEDDNRSLEAYQEMLARRGDANRTEISSLQVASQLAGWPTPDANAFEAKDLTRLQERREECKERTGNGNGFGLTLGQAAPLLTSGWPTARAEDSESTGAHRGSPDTLTSAAQVSGWPTPNSANADRGGFATEEGLRERMESGHQKNLQEVVGVAGWCTPNAMDGGQTSRGGDRIGESLLAGQAQAAGWATPNAGLSTRSGYQDQEYTKARKEAGKQVDLMDEAQTLTTGAQPGSPAQTGPRGVLNPQFPLWLMGYPEAWATCAPGHQSWATVQKVLSETPDASARAYCEGPGTP